MSTIARFSVMYYILEIGFLLSRFSLSLSQTCARTALTERRWKITDEERKKCITWRYAFSDSSIFDVHKYYAYAYHI